MLSIDLGYLAILCFSALGLTTVTGQAALCVASLAPGAHSRVLRRLEPSAHEELRLVLALACAAMLFLFFVDKDFSVFASKPYPASLNSLLHDAAEFGAPVLWAPAFLLLLCRPVVWAGYVAGSAALMALMYATHSAPLGVLLQVQPETWQAALRAAAFAALHSLWLLAPLSLSTLLAWFLHGVVRDTRAPASAQTRSA